MSDSFLYIRIVSNFHSLFYNVQKNLSFLNHNILRQTQSQLFLEDIQGGLLYVYKNFELFALLNQPLSSTTLKKLQKSDMQGAAFFFGKNLSAANYPAEGIKITFTVSGIAIKETIALYLSYFQSYHEPSIVVKQAAPDTIEVNFTQYLGLQLYAQRLSRFLTDFM